MADTLYIKRHDLQPYYKARIVDSSGDAVDLTGSSIQATFANVIDGTVVFSIDNSRININSASGGIFECQWTGSDTAIAGRYCIEFSITPNTGGKFTVPAKENALVIILEDRDNG